MRPLRLQTGIFLLQLSLVSTRRSCKDAVDFVFYQHSTKRKKTYQLWACGNFPPYFMTLCYIQNVTSLNLLTGVGAVP